MVWYNYSMLDRHADRTARIGNMRCFGEDIKQITPIVNVGGQSYNKIIDEGPSQCKV